MNVKRTSDRTRLGGVFAYGILSKHFEYRSMITFRNVNVGIHLKTDLNMDSLVEFLNNCSSACFEWDFCVTHSETERKRKKKQWYSTTLWPWMWLEFFGIHVFLRGRERASAQQRFSNYYGFIWKKVFLSTIWFASMQRIYKTTNTQKTDDSDRL